MKWDPASEAFIFDEREQEVANRLPSNLLPGYLRLRRALSRKPEPPPEGVPQADLMAQNAVYVLAERLSGRAEPLRLFPFDPHGHRPLLIRDAYPNVQVDRRTEMIAFPGEVLMSLVDSMQIASARQPQALRAVLLGSAGERQAARAVLEQDPIPIRSFTAGVCIRCGRFPSMRFDGSVLHAAEPCAYDDAWTLQVELDVPSGLLCVGRQVRGLFRLYGDPAAHHPFWHQPYQMETAAAYFEECARAFAAEGCVCLEISATIPTWYAHRDDPERFTIGEPRNRNRMAVPEGLKHVRGLFRSGSSIMLADHDLVAARWHGSKATLRNDAVPIPPGRYRFSDVTHRVGFGREARLAPFRSCVQVERIGSVTGQPGLRIPRTAGQILHNFQRNALSSRARDPYAFLRAAFCAKDFRDVWRREGEPQFFLDFPPTEAEANLPPLDTMLPLRLRRTSALVEIVESRFPLSPAMLDLARRFLACIVAHGVTADEKGVEFFPSVCTAQQELAAELLGRLEGRGPTWR